MENLTKLFKEMDSFEKELSLLSLVLKKIEEDNIVLHYSDEFILELKNISKSFDYLKSINVNIFNLLIDTFDRDYSEKSKILFNIKKEILSSYSEEDLSFLRINHLNLTKFFQKNKDLLSYYQDNKFISFKDLSKLNKKDVNNFFILKKEYELNYLKTFKFSIFHKDFKSTIIKDSTYNKPVYLGLKHLQQKDNYIFMEGPYFSQKATCPKCDSKIIHLLEGLTKDGSIYTCSNLNCSFFITGNFFIKTGYKDLINFFNIPFSFEEKRNSSHNRIFHSLSCIKFKDSFIDIIADDFTFFYKYQIEEHSIGFRLNKIKYKDKFLYLHLFYQKRRAIYNFLDYILNFD